ncbi:MAG: sialate O-acetylesterase [Thermoguttaceae bacterium]
MPRRTWLLTLVCFLLVLGGTVFAQTGLELPAIFGDHMVLQRDRPVVVWGSGNTGDEVTVSIAGQNVKTEIDDNGHWSITLAKLEASDKPLEMTVKTSAGDSITYKDVLVGEVWLCSGQSNMRRGVIASENGKKEIAAAQFPQIRLISVPNVGTQEPQSNFAGAWVACSPQTVGKFSATGYFFGRAIYQALKVPVGLIDCSWSGSTCESWINRSALEADPEYREMLTKWDEVVKSYDPQKAEKEWQDKKAQWQRQVAEAKTSDKTPPKAPPKPNDPRTGNARPANCYNGMLLPLKPFTIRGVIWYQGEANIGRPDQYRHLFPLLIRQWREEWGQGDFPFGFVQIAPYRYKNHDPADCAKLWEAQTMTLQNSPNTGMVVTVDIGDVANIHPKNKQEVGRRLALWALAKVYDRPQIYSGPLYKSMAVEGDKIRLQFDHIGGGLIAQDDKPLTEFTIAGDNQHFEPATAVIDGDTIVVHSDRVAQPAAVRFAWRDTASPNLAKKEGLPASPFRTDTWKKSSSEK